MKRILVVVPELSYSGSVFSSKRICSVLINCGYSVDVWSYQQGPFEREFKKLDIFPKVIDKNIVYNNREIEKDLEKYDLVISNTIITYALADISKNIVPTIWYIREAQNLKWQFLKNDHKRYYALKRAENIYAVSEYAREFIVQNYNSNVRVVHNAVEDEFYKYQKGGIEKSDKIRLLALGTIETRKAFDIYIAAYLLLDKKEQDEIEIHFAGRLIDAEKEYFTALLEIVREHEGIFYHGEIQDRDKLMQLMNETDVVVVPSKDESCSLVALEAIMMSKPIILSNNIGAKYVLSKENGWLFETDNIKSLSNVYRNVIDKKYCLKEMGKYSRKKYLETSTFDIYAENIVKMVEENLVSDKEKYRTMHFEKAQEEYIIRVNEEKCRPYKYDFSELKLEENKKVVIYAAGEVGHAFYEYIKQTKKYKMVLWVDKNHEKISRSEVKAIKELFSVEYDYIYISILNEKVAKEIVTELINCGVEEKKLVWDPPTRIDLLGE